VRIAVVRDGGRARRAVVDSTGTLPGRGAYLCRIGSDRPDPDCLRLATRRGGISRALRCAATLDVEHLESGEWVAGEVKRALDL
jgi:uncharacterized protein